jgi:hypothetical protein
MRSATAGTRLCLKSMTHPGTGRANPTHYSQLVVCELYVGLSEVVLSQPTRNSQRDRIVQVDSPAFVRRFRVTHTSDANDAFVIAALIARQIVHM